MKQEGENAILIFMDEIISKTNQKLLILTGPTGVGKTRISIALAKALNGEIISADSVAVYRGLDIGSAKIKEKDMQGIPHHLIDVLDPTDDFNVMVFQSLAKDAMSKIWAKGKLPILVGGTGFYIQALRRGVEFAEEEENPGIRKRLETEAEVLGKEAMHERLQSIDPLSYERIPAGNLKRVIRALEFYEMHGFPISEHNDTEKAKKSVYDDLCIVLTDRREKLYENINLRVDEMVEEGLVDEIRSLKEQGLNESHLSMQGIGYKEIYAALKGEYSLEEAVEKVKINTRHFAKRQITYFKGMEDVIWFDKSGYEHPDEEIADAIIVLGKKLLAGEKIRIESALSN